MTTYLDEILEHKREEVARQKLKVPLDELRERARSAPAARPFGAVLRLPNRAALIAEIKQRSPSRGLLAPDFDHRRLAQTYLDNGADAISVLTDVRFFGGSLQFLKAIRMLEAQHAAGVPLLRKDFILDGYQVWEARAYGADALLLIVAALQDAELHELLALTEDLGMEALVEVHDAAELERALQAGASVVGVNNRDLRSFRVDLATTERLAALLDGCDRPVLVGESGISAAADVERLRAAGCDAILVGEAIVTAPNIAAKVRELAGRETP